MSRSHDCEIDQNPGMTGNGMFYFGCYQQIESREKASKCSYSDGLMTIYEIRDFVVCIF